MNATPRRLAAIMFTDLVGFTRLAQRNEELALQLRREHQLLVRPIFVAHGGREVKTMGDGFLVEFPSAVESVRCAIAVQDAVAARNALPTTKEPILLRVGIHMGDVVDEAGDIVGDAVNVASRIEPLAEPGGICVTASVFEQVRNKLPAPLERIGPRSLKNVELPMDVYRVVLGRSASAPPGPPPAGPAPLRLAVLPFANLSVEPSDEYFADGLTDELISRTSGIPALRVIARTSVRQYKGSAKSIRDVGQELNVGLALEGSVRKAGRRVRITVRLVDTRSEEHLWSGRYDRPMDDIFAIQDDIAGQIAASLTAHVAGHGGSPPSPSPLGRGTSDTRDMDAYTAFLHGKKLLGEKGSEETVQQALALFESAVQRDPHFARARAGVADAVLWLAGEGAYPLTGAVPRARSELALALAENDALAEAHSVLAGLLLGEDELAAAEREARRAMELNPSLADPYRWLAQLKAGDGRIDETVRLLEAAHQLDPVDVNIMAFLGRAYAYAGRDQDALAHWARTKSMVAFRTNAHLAEYYFGLGDLDKVRLHLREMERLRPDSVWTETYRGMLAARTGDIDGARRALDRLKRRARGGEMTAFFAGFVHLYLGEMDEFVACLEESFRAHSLPLMELTYSRAFERARSDPRVLDLLRRQAELRDR